MISGYFEARSWLHRVPAGVKLAALATISMGLLPINDWRLLLAGLCLCLALYASLGKAALRRAGGGMRAFLPILMILFALHLLSGDPRAGASAVIRLVLMVLLADLVSMTTTMQAMMNALMPLLRLLQPLGVNPRKLALAVALVIRFVPVLNANWQARSEAWRARTGRRASYRLIAPFIAETLRLADQVAESLDARGFDRRGRGM
ncbi:energy-coupling factor transporter transmembrane component T family protein [Terrihabitans sp. B22-R8]|uniref:energy-coupling factor transporter transmembrane component T family protein n=1 Tax=Terrihabitans sp. B22-R8 TaxID=3425128 RepID=UPI00403C85E4